jgi:hypothetical protein
MAEAITDEFIDNCVAAAAGYALWFAGVPDYEVMRSLDGVRAHMQAQLAATYPDDAAALIAQAFVSAVLGRRREIGAAGTIPSALN